MKQDLMPTFEAGERVIAHVRPIEVVCPFCGYVAGTNRFNGLDIPAVIIKKAEPLFTCPKCEEEYEYPPDGWWVVEAENPPRGMGRIAGFPYTLLEKLDSVLPVPGGELKPHKERT